MSQGRFPKRRPPFLYLSKKQCQNNDVIPRLRGNDGIVRERRGDTGWVRQNPVARKNNTSVGIAEFRLRNFTAPCGVSGRAQAVYFSQTLNRICAHPYLIYPPCATPANPWDSQNRGPWRDLSREFGYLCNEREPNFFLFAYLGSTAAAFSANSTVFSGPPLILYVILKVFTTLLAGSPKAPL